MQVLSIARLPRLMSIATNLCQLHQVTLEAYCSQIEHLKEPAVVTSAFVRHRGRISRPAFCLRALVPLILIALALVLILIALALVLIALALVLIAFPPEPLLHHPSLGHSLMQDY